MSANIVAGGVAPPARSGRILLTTFGSLGDLHPYLAIALGLKERGHDPVIATSAVYRQRVEELGIEFRPVPPDVPDPATSSELVARMMNSQHGSERVFREMIMPSVGALRATYEATRAAADGADLLVSHLLAVTVRLIAEETGLPWVSTMVQPLGFFSAYDPPVIPGQPLINRLRFMGPGFHRALFRLSDRITRPWSEPWRELRQELGLPSASDNPVMSGQHSPRSVLGLFSSVFAPRQPDWPPQTVVTGFPFFEHDTGGSLSPELRRFLGAGEPPIVFTLGSAAVMDAGAFYEQSVAAVRTLGRRAVLLTGHDPRNVPAHLPDDVIAVPYAPHGAIFPRAAVTVHQGGIGTTAQALRAGKPMLVVPWAHDQPDNARRVTEMGVGRTIDRHRYNADRAVRLLQSLLDDPTVSRRAAEAGELIRQEDGVAVACALLEQALAGARGAPEAATAT